jgi:hypothetical protein
MATGRMYIHPTQHILRNEAADYPLGEHDDVLDALALHLQLFVGQMSTERWDKYKASERKLLRVLSGRTRDVGAPKDNRGLLLADPRKGILDIDDDEEDERPNASWTEVIVG